MSKVRQTFSKRGETGETGELPISHLRAKIPLFTIRGESAHFHNSPYSPKREISKYLLYFYKIKENIRVKKGKKRWNYWNKNDELPELREILSDEIVIEFDSTYLENEFGKKWKDWTALEQMQFISLSWEAINFTAINLYNDGIKFEIWEHGGKSPHLHIHNLPISHLPKDDLRLWKKSFIKHYVPEKFLKYADFSNCGIGLIALEGVNHWKGCYGIKRLVWRF